MPVDQVVAVGPDKPKEEQNSGQQSKEDTGKDSQQTQKTPSPSPSPSQDSQSATTPTPTPTQTKPPQTTQTTKPKQPSTPAPAMPENKPAPSPAPSPSRDGLWHAEPGVAQAYAGGAAAQRGWTGSQFDDLVKLWNKESRWLWNAENPSGAYGIPQAYPGSKMALFGANWRDDAAVQIDWGLWYIGQQYGNPSTAWHYWQQYNWY